LTYIAADLTLDILKNFNDYAPVKQDDTISTHCSKISKANGLVSFDDAYTLYNKFRAFTPWPGVYLESGLKLKEIVLQSRQGNYKPGEILVVAKDSFIVGCKQGSIRVNQLQAPSKKQVDGASYLNGKKLKRADTLV